MSSKKRRAFTLTELLVVVVIIGVLSAVVLPKFTKVLETRKTTEAEAMMVAVRNEQEARCSISKNYTADLGKLASLNKQSDTKNYKYEDFEGVGVQASAKGSYAYNLRMPSYVDGRICCDGEDCEKLNKDYPTCDELQAKGDYVPGNAQCEADPVECSEGSTQGSQTCNGCGTQTTQVCREGQWVSELGSCSKTKEDCATCTEGATQGSQTCNGCGTQTTQVCREGQWVDELGACSKTEEECAEGCEWEEGVIVPFEWEGVDCDYSWAKCGQGNKYKCIKDEDGDPYLKDLGVAEGVCPLTQEEKETCSCQQKPSEEQPCRYGYDGKLTCNYKCDTSSGHWVQEGKCKNECVSNMRWVLSLTEYGCSKECAEHCNEELSDLDTQERFRDVWRKIPSNPNEIAPCDAYGISVTKERCSGIIHTGGQTPPWEGSLYYAAAPRKQVLTYTCLPREEDHRGESSVLYGDELLGGYILLTGACHGCETVMATNTGSGACVNPYDHNEITRVLGWDPGHCNVNFSDSGNYDNWDDWVNSISNWGSGVSEPETNVEIQVNPIVVDPSSLFPEEKCHVNTILTKMGSKCYWYMEQVCTRGYKQTNSRQVTSPMEGPCPSSM